MCVSNVDTESNVVFGFLPKYPIRTLPGSTTDSVSTVVVGVTSTVVLVRSHSEVPIDKGP